MTKKFYGILTKFEEEYLISDNNMISIFHGTQADADLKLKTLSVGEENPCSIKWIDIMNDPNVKPFVGWKAVWDFNECEEGWAIYKPNETYLDDQGVGGIHEDVLSYYGWDEIMESYCSNEDGKTKDEHKLQLESLGFTVVIENRAEEINYPYMEDV